MNEDDQLELMSNIHGLFVSSVHLTGRMMVLESTVEALAPIFHGGIEQRSGERVRRLVNTEPNETATHRFFEYRL